MESKLTLTLQKKTIEKGKAYARKKRTSLSKLVESYSIASSLTYFFSSSKAIYSLIVVMILLRIIGSVRNLGIPMGLDNIL
jgi:hypothetical protein